MQKELEIKQTNAIPAKDYIDIVLCDSRVWITEAAILRSIDLKSEKVLALQHLVLSHHNLGEWGSTVQRQTAEAVALHHIEALDAKLQMVEDALDSSPETESWTPVIQGLENKAIYRMKF